MAGLYRATIAALDAAAPVAGLHLLDAGCGAGLALEIAAERGVTVAGLDATPELLFGAELRGEERSQRIVSREHVMSLWSDEDQLQFRRYAYPLSDEVYVLWDENPAEWAPQNHSCEPNTGFHGLNVIALRAIAKGEELTLDYAELLNEESEPFECTCGAASCRGLVTGTAGNTVGASASASS